MSAVAAIGKREEWLPPSLEFLKQLLQIINDLS
jgi:hypothetical protein